jgi:hypothetical protein
MLRRMRYRFRLEQEKGFALNHTHSRARACTHKEQTVQFKSVYDYVCIVARMWRLL